jgi:hypothetical protein
MWLRNFSLHRTVHPETPTSSLPGKPAEAPTMTPLPASVPINDPFVSSLPVSEETKRMIFSPFPRAKIGTLNVSLVRRCEREMSMEGKIAYH